MDNLVKIMGQAIFCYQLSRNAPCRQQKGTLNISMSKKQAPYHFTSTLQTPGSSPLERPSRNLFSNYTDATDIHKFEAAKHWVCFRSITKQKAKSLPCISSCFSLFSPHIFLALSKNILTTTQFPTTKCTTSRQCLFNVLRITHLLWIQNFNDLCNGPRVKCRDDTAARRQKLQLERLKNKMKTSWCLIKYEYKLNDLFALKKERRN